MDVSDTGSPSAWSGTDQVSTRVLVFGMVRDDGRLLSEDLLPVAEACGLSSEQVRSCLRRMVDEKLFTRTGAGRSAIYRPTGHGAALIDAAMERRSLAYTQDAKGAGWDRRWHLVGFTIGEKRRKARATLRDWLLHNGGASLQSGLYVSPHPWEPVVQAEAEAIGVAEHVTYASTDDLSLGGVTSPKVLATMLWPLDDIAAGYRGFIAEYGGVPAALDTLRRAGRRLTEAEFLAGALAMVVRYQECQDADPLLPPELLERDWPGREARKLAHDCREQGLHLRDTPNGPLAFAAIDHLATPLL